MSALHLVYQHWFITILLSMFAVAPVAWAVALGIVGFTVKLRGGK